MVLLLLTGLVMWAKGMRRRVFITGLGMVKPLGNPARSNKHVGTAIPLFDN